MFDGIIVSKKTKTLLSYPGGKVRAIKIICEFIPKDIPALCSPFFGGGAIELACAEVGVKVYGYDVFNPLVNFWQCVFEDSGKVADYVDNLYSATKKDDEYYPLSRERFYELQHTYDDRTDSFECAAVFYILNKTSFSGLTFSGGLSRNQVRFTKSAIERLRVFDTDNVEVKCMDFTKSIPKHSDDFLYLDPPYYIKDNLYGVKGDTHKGFRHDLLAEILKGRDRWILSYNNCPEVLELYSGYKMLYPKWSYAMGANKKSKEVLIFSKEG